MEGEKKNENKHTQLVFPFCFRICHLSVRVSEGRCVYMHEARAFWVWETGTTYIVILHELCLVERFKAAFERVIQVYLHGYTQTPTRWFSYAER